MLCRLSLLLGIIRLLNAKTPVFNKNDLIRVNLQSYLALLFPLHIVLNAFISLLFANFVVAMLSLGFVSAKKSVFIHRNLNALLSIAMLVLPLISKEYYGASITFSIAIMISILFSAAPFYNQKEFIQLLINEHLSAGYSPIIPKNKNLVLFENKENISLFAANLAYRIIAKNKLKEFVDHILSLHFTPDEINEIIQDDNFRKNTPYCTFYEFDMILHVNFGLDIDKDRKKLAWWIMHWFAREQDYNAKKENNNININQEKSSIFEELKKRQNL